MFEQTDDEVEHLLAERRTLAAQRPPPESQSDGESIAEILAIIALIATVVFGVYFGGMWLLARWFEQ